MGDSAKRNQIKARHLRPGGGDNVVCCPICLAALCLGVESHKALVQCPACSNLMHAGCFRKHLQGHNLDESQTPTCPNCKQAVAGYRVLDGGEFDYDRDAWKPCAELVDALQEEDDADYLPGQGRARARHRHRAASPAAGSSNDKSRKLRHAGRRPSASDRGEAAEAQAHAPASLDGPGAPSHEYTPEGVAALEAEVRALRERVALGESGEREKEG